MRDATKITSVLFTVALLSIPLLLAQRPAQKPSFEVASIKRNLSTQAGGGGGPRGDRFTYRNVPVTALIQYAFGPPKGQLFSQQIIGGPEWIRRDRYDIDAKMSGSMPSVTHEQMKGMAQSLLEDRFQLKWRKETRELPVYDLVVAKAGLKMRQSADQTPIHSNQADLFFDSFAERSKSLPRGTIRLAT